jgi:hypothetical protein
MRPRYRCRGAVEVRRGAVQAAAGEQRFLNGLRHIGPCCRRSNPRVILSYNENLTGFTSNGADYTVITFAESVEQLTIKGVTSTSFTLALLDA